MSEGEDAGREEVWIEKYRPRRFDDIVGQDAIVERLASYVERDDLPHMLFAGRAGIGKCATGETPLLTGDGVARMETVVGDADGLAPVNDNTRVLTLQPDGTFEYVEPSHRFSKPADEVVAVRTRDGADLSVTPEHKLLVCGEAGLTWRPASDLDPGDRLVRPLEVPLPETDPSLDWITAMDGERTLVHLDPDFARRHAIPVEQRYVGTKRCVVRGLREGLDRAEIADSAGTTRKNVARIVRELGEVDLDGTSRICSLSHLRTLECPRSTLREHVEAIQNVPPSNNGRAPAITPVWSVDPTLARLVGLLVAESRIDGSRIKFNNTNENLLEAVDTALRELFGVEPTRGSRDDVPFVEVGNQTLVNFLGACFDVFDTVSGDEGIGSTLVRADAKSRAAFLRAMFDAEGFVSESGTLELTQKDGDIVTLLSYLLAGFGVPSRRATAGERASNGSGKARSGHSLHVSGAPHLERFRERVGFSVADKAERLSQISDRSSNPNHDTVPDQRAVTELCSRLHLDRDSVVPESLDAPTHDREHYDAVIDRVLGAATERLERVREALAELDAMEPVLADATAVPGTWGEHRGVLGPVGVRRTATEEHGIRSGRLLEYARSDRTQSVDRTFSLPETVAGSVAVPDVDRLRTVLSDIIADLEIPYARIADRTALRNNDVGRLVDSADHESCTLPRFRTVTEALRSELATMASSETIEHLSTLHRVVEADVYLDEVRAVERNRGDHRVYDLTIPETRNYVAGAVPTVMHNTTAAQAVARELYDEDWTEHFLELNASDERGIDVVRDRIKSFARTSFGGANYRIIFLDEADALCVPPGAEVVTGYPSSPEVKPIEEVAEDGEPIPSVDFETNEIQPDTGRLVDSGIADFYELRLDDGRTVEASPEHPFFVVGPDGSLVEKELRELSPGDEIADFSAEVGVSKCEICGSWTTGRCCSVARTDEGHSRDTRGEGNPKFGTEWSDGRRTKIAEALSGDRFAGENNPNYEGNFHDVSVWEMDDEQIKRFRDHLGDLRSDTRWEDWVVDADPELVNTEISETMAEVWEAIDAKGRERRIENAAESCTYPVAVITGDDNLVRDPEVAQKISEAVMGHEPSGGENTRYSEELGHPVPSGWEFDVAKALQDADVDYEYEPEFELSKTVFRPDFLVDDTVIEVKGVASLWDQIEKLDEFLDTYGDEYQIIVVGDPERPYHEVYDGDECEPSVVSDGGRPDVNTVAVRDIEYSHQGKAYNITMDGTPNFVLANGLLTHNTSDAQSALRRTMEQFSNNVRFILSCNYSSQIIDPIQSRCAVFRFSPLSDEAVEEQIRRIADAEGIELTQDGVDALVYAADGDMRRAINGLQAAAVTDGPVDEEAVYEITSTARPEDIREMVTRALEGDFTGARSELDRLLTEEGIAGGDVLDQLHRAVWEFDLDDEAAVRVLDRIGEADYRITEGANERVQLEALLASLALD